MGDVPLSADSELVALLSSHHNHQHPPPRVTLSYFLDEVFGGGGKYIGLFVLPAAASSAFAEAASLNPWPKGLLGNVGLLMAKDDALGALGVLK